MIQQDIKPFQSCCFLFKVFCYITFKFLYKHTSCNLQQTFHFSLHTLSKPEFRSCILPFYQKTKHIKKKISISFITYFINNLLEFFCLINYTFFFFTYPFIFSLYHIFCKTHNLSYSFLTNFYFINLIFLWNFLSSSFSFIAYTYTPSNTYYIFYRTILSFLYSHK